MGRVTNDNKNADVLATSLHQKKSHRESQPSQRKSCNFPTQPNPIQPNPWMDPSSTSSNHVQLWLTDRHSAAAVHRVDRCQRFGVTWKLEKRATYKYIHEAAITIKHHTLQFEVTTITLKSNVRQLCPRWSSTVAVEPTFENDRDRVSVNYHAK